MKTIKNIAFVVGSIALACLVLLPTAVEFSHVFEKHEHVACSEVSTHLHEKEFDCSLCDFKISVYHFTPSTSFSDVTIQYYKELPFTSTSQKRSVELASYLLRGPPGIV